MTVSRAEAVDILRKWSMESTSLFIALVGCGFGLMLSGSINDVTGDGAVIADGKLVFAFDPIEKFEYADYRDAPPPIQQVLVQAKDQITAYLAMTSGPVQCLLCERA